MRLFVVAFFLVAFLDALSTYVVISTSRGVEANPAFATVINNNPASVFFLWLVSAVPMSMATIVVERLVGRLPAALRVKVIRALSAVYVAAVLIRAAVVVNNLIIAA
jgi:hypothetical protein